MPLKYVGDRFVIDCGESKPLSVMDGAVLYETGCLNNEGFYYISEYVKINGAWSLIDPSSSTASNSSSVTLDDIENLDSSLRYLSLPQDGVYGANGGIAGVKAGDTKEEAFNKVEEIFEKLAPPKPPDFNDVSFNFDQITYSAFEEGTKTLRQNIINQDTATASINELFFDGDKGTIKAFRDDQLTGEKILTTEEDTGIFSGLKIIQDVDYHSGTAGKEGFWKGLEVRVETSKIDQEKYFKLDLSYEKDGSENTKELEGYFGTPTTSATKSISISGWNASSSAKYIDGVPSYVNGSLQVSGLKTEGQVGSFYRNGVLVNLSLAYPYASSTSTYQREDISEINDVIVSDPQPSKGSRLKFEDKSLSLLNSNASNPNLIARSYDYTGAQILSQNFSTNLYSDSSNQQSNRVKSGQGRFPSSYGGVYDNSEDLSLNEELLLKQGRIFFPNHNFSVYTPQGPNYSSLQSASYEGYRWYTVDAGQIINKNNVIVTINGAQGFEEAQFPEYPGQSLKFQMYIKVEGVTGWLDGDKAYNLGTPISDGDACLVVGADTTTTIRKMTFGSTPRSGKVYVRIGVNLTTRSFTNLTVSFT